MARSVAAAVAPAHDVDWRDIQPLSEADLNRAQRLGYRECWYGSDGMLRLTVSGSGSIRMALLEGRFLPVVRERDEDGVAVVRPVVFAGLTIRPVDGRMVELSDGKETMIVAADRWTRRLASRLPRVIRARLGQAVAGHTDLAMQAAREIRVRET
jgi:hypothetical protein